MNNGFIGVFDSGVGGVCVLQELIKKLPNERFIYYGDNVNLPYGNKRKDELLLITLNNINNVSNNYRLKAIVLACNTLSVNVIKQVQENVNCKVFGVFPPVESCVLNGEKTLLLATVQTAKAFRGKDNCHVIGLKTLASEIEKNAPFLENVNLSRCLDKANVMGEFVNQKGYYDSVILGCTHYELIKNKILDHFCPKKILSGTKFTTKMVAEFFKYNKSLVNYKRNHILFIGENAKTYENTLVFGGQKW